MFIGGDLGSFLSLRDYQSELLMKLVEVHYKVASMGRDEVSFRVDGEVWVVALIGEEG